MITNHGMHDWRVTPGLPDTGGQNVYVNHLTDAMVGLGRTVTIVNRGGYIHPGTGILRAGTAHRHGNRARIVYLTDDVADFVRKEDMFERLPALAAGLARLLENQHYDLIISHYWDGAALGLRAAELAGIDIPHIWIPHSVGSLKKRNMDPTSWERLRLDERIVAEKEIFEQVDGVVATSAMIRQAIEDDYGYRPEFFMPPGVDARRYRPRTDLECPGTWEFIAAHLDRPVDDVRGRPMIIEVSRTDRTKRKDLLLRAFARLRLAHPDALLAVTIDDGNRPLHDRLLELIDELDLRGSVAVLGSVWQHLPCLYSLSSVYCTPSVMEGFGMSAQEAAASGIPVVASDLVPFATEYLLGPDPSPASADGITFQVGAGAIVVPPDSETAVTAAVDLLLGDAELRGRMGAAARAVTVPSLTWDRLTAGLLDAADRLVVGG
jgi:glycosyltransferase involved in cell wall biosynthesis